MNQCAERFRPVPIHREGPPQEQEIVQVLSGQTVVDFLLDEIAESGGDSSKNGRADLRSLDHHSRQLPQSACPQAFVSVPATCDESYRSFGSFHWASASRQRDANNGDYVLK